MEQRIMRGDIWLADMNLSVGSEQNGVRCVLCIQNNIGNRFSPTVIVAGITSKGKKKMPTHVELDALENGLKEDSVVLCEQLRTLDKMRFICKLSTIRTEDMLKVDDAIRVSVGLPIESIRYEYA